MLCIKLHHREKMGALNDTSRCEFHIAQGKSQVRLPASVQVNIHMMLQSGMCLISHCNWHSPR